MQNQRFPLEKLKSCDDDFVVILVGASESETPTRIMHDSSGGLRFCSSLCVGGRGAGEGGGESARCV